MNLHSNFRYPFFKYIIEEFSGTFYEDDLISLNRLLINRFSFRVRRNDVGEFVTLANEETLVLYLLLVPTTVTPSSCW